MLKKLVVFAVLFFLVLSVVVPVFSQGTEAPGYHTIEFSSGNVKVSAPNDWYFIRRSDYNTRDEFDQAVSELLDTVEPENGSHEWSSSPDTFGFGTPQVVSGERIYVYVHYSDIPCGNYEDIVSGEKQLNAVEQLVVGTQQLTVLENFNGRIYSILCLGESVAYVELRISEMKVQGDNYDSISTRQAADLIANLNRGIRSDAAVLLLSLREVGADLDIVEIEGIVGFPISGVAPQLP